MATAAAVADDLTTCPICCEVFDVPKALPCLHAFCLKCLQGHFKDKRPGDEVPCPMCRKAFQIPSDGLAGLQHHFIIERLVDIQKASSSELEEGPLCDVCLYESEQHFGVIRTATTYCVDCKLKLCDPCSRPHRRGSAHLLIPLGAEVEQELNQRRGKHKDKRNKWSYIAVTVSRIFVSK